MSEMDKLRQAIETNFRLNSLETREIAAQLGGDIRQLGGDIRQMGGEVHRMGGEVHRIGGEVHRIGGEVHRIGAEVGQVAQKVTQLGDTFEQGLARQDDRNQQTLAAINRVLDNTVDLRKTVIDHERRLLDLEDEAS